MDDLTPVALIFDIFAFLLAISIHETAHGWVANKLGDPTARLQGRLTLNPLAHLDPWGALVLVLSKFRFGWAKPVPVDPRYFRDPLRGMMLVGLAGPVANFLLASLLAIPLRLGILASGGPELVTAGQFLYALAELNIGLGVFNLIPFPPLDGSRILMGLLPRRYAYQFAQLEAMAPFLLLILLMSGILTEIVTPAFFLVHRLILGF